jgi:hypothetical protein
MCSRQPDRNIHLLHKACAQLACQRFKDNTAEVLDTLSSQTNPFLSQNLLALVGDQATSRLLKNAMLTLPLNSLRLNTDLGRLLSQIRRAFPFEIQIEIFNQASGLFRCLATCSATLD